MESSGEDTLRGARAWTRTIWRQRIVLAVVTAQGTALGCNSISEQEIPDIFLEPVAQFRFIAEDAPVAAAAQTSDTFVLVPPARDRVVLFDKGDERNLASFPEGRILAVTADSTAFWIAVDNLLLSADAESLALKTEFEGDPQEYIREIAVSGRHIWIVVAAESGSRLVALQRGNDDRLEQYYATALPTYRVGLASWANGGILLYENGAPYGLRALSHTGVEEYSVTPLAYRLTQISHPTATQDWALTAAVPLTSDLVVQWFTDLRSLERIAVTVKLSDNRQTRSIVIRSPLGLIHALPTQRDHVLASQEIPSGRQLIIYRMTVEDSTKRVLE